MGQTEQTNKKFINCVTTNLSQLKKYIIYIVYINAPDSVCFIIEPDNICDPVDNCKQTNLLGFGFYLLIYV